MYSLKKKFAIIAIFNCVWLCAQHNYKTSYRAGLKLGYSLHTLTGDLTKTHPGQNLIGGFWFQLKMNKKWTAQTELILLDKGIGVRGSRKSPHFVNLHYIEFPVLFQYHREMIYYEFGPGLGYLINYREHLYGNETPDLVIKHPFSRSELSFNIGIGCNLTEKWTFGLRLSHSLLPVRYAVPKVSKASYNLLLALSVTRQLKKRKKKASDPQE
ncbi:hypothetical protein CNR22_02440 [Sphingobacteriaceae bacterium]|nr:hypothetical protein CNR22_02440 [Sphingobacteriaceae bacterium]